MKPLQPIKVVARREAGQAVVMMTLGSLVIFGMVGLVVDVGYGYYLKQEAQAAADSAAMAGAMMAKEPSPVATPLPPRNFSQMGNM